MVMWFKCRSKKSRVVCPKDVRLKDRVPVAKPTPETVTVENPAVGAVKEERNDDIDRVVRLVKMLKTFKGGRPLPPLPPPEEDDDDETIVSVAGEDTSAKKVEDKKSSSSYRTTVPESKETKSDIPTAFLPGDPGEIPSTSSLRSHPSLFMLGNSEEEAV